MTLAIRDGRLIFANNGLGQSPGCCCPDPLFCCCQGSLNDVFDFFGVPGFLPGTGPRITGPLTRGSNAVPNGCGQIPAITSSKKCDSSTVGLLVEWCGLLAFNSSGAPDPIPPSPANCNNPNNPFSGANYTCVVQPIGIGGCTLRVYSLLVTAPNGFTGDIIRGSCGRCFIFGRILWNGDDRQNCGFSKEIYFYRRQDCDSETITGLYREGVDGIVFPSSVNSPCADTLPEITITFAP